MKKLAIPLLFLVLLLTGCGSQPENRLNEEPAIAENENKDQDVEKSIETIKVNLEDLEKNINSMNISEDEVTNLSL